MDTDSAFNTLREPAILICTSAWQSTGFFRGTGAVYYKSTATTYYVDTHMQEFNEGMNGLLSNHPSSQLTLIGSDTDTSGCRAALRSATSTADKTSDLASPSS